MLKNAKVKFLCLGFITLNIFDILTTWLCIQAGLIEYNPIMNYFLMLGFGYLVLVKIPIAIILIYVYDKLIKTNKYYYFGLIFINIMYVYIVLNNLYWLQRSMI